MFAPPTKVPNAKLASQSDRTRAPKPPQQVPLHLGFGQNNQAVLGFEAQTTANLTASVNRRTQEVGRARTDSSTATETASWDFSKIPVVAPDRSIQHPTPSLLVQPKLAIGRTNDPLEHEADRAADQVTRMSTLDLTRSMTPPQLTRKRADGQVGEEAQMLHTKPVGLSKVAAGEPADLVHKVLRTPGQPLDASTRAYFEPRFRHDFSHVRVHVSSAAAESARTINALAYTVGRNVVFAPHMYEPHSRQGQKLLAHELAHVVQTSAQAGSVIRRQPDPRVQQSMTPQEVSALSNEEIDKRLQATFDLLRTQPEGTPEHAATRANLMMLEEEIDSRGYYSPVQAREGLVSAAAQLISQLDGVKQSLAALFAPKAFGGQGAIDLFKRQFGDNNSKQEKWIRDAAEAARREAINAPKSDRNATFAAFGSAGTKLVAAAFGLQLLSVWLAFLKLSDLVLHQVPFYSVERLFAVISGISPRVAGPSGELASLDAARVEAATATLPAALDKLIAEHGSLVNEVETAAKNGQKLMQAQALVDLVTAVASMRITRLPTAPGPPLVSASLVPGGMMGNALAGGRLVVSVEWVEMIRRLVATGVIAAPVVAAGTRAGIMMMASGTPVAAGGVQTAQGVISGGTAPLVPGKSNLGQYGIDKYGTFANRPRDKLAGHEMLQNLWLEVKGFGKRLRGPASRENPAMALTHEEHVAVNREQQAAGLNDRSKLQTMSAEQIIEANAEAMKRAKIPDYAIEALKKEALQYAATLKLPSGATP